MPRRAGILRVVKPKHGSKVPCLLVSLRDDATMSVRHIAEAHAAECRLTYLPFSLSTRAPAAEICWSGDVGEGSTGTTVFWLMVAERLVRAHIGQEVRCHEEKLSSLARSRLRAPGGLMNQ